jgi:hypothetical protein
MTYLLSKRGEGVGLRRTFYPGVIGSKSRWCYFFFFFFSLFFYIQMFFCTIMKLFITLLVNVNKSRAGAISVSLTCRSTFLLDLFTFFKLFYLESFQQIPSAFLKGADTTGMNEYFCYFCCEETDQAIWLKLGSLQSF